MTARHPSLGNSKRAIEPAVVAVLLPGLRAEYGSRLRLRNDPRITGLWQVSGRHKTPFGVVDMAWAS